MRLAALLGLSVALAASTLAQPATRTLVVEGIAEVDAPPDLATIAFVVETRGRDAEAVFLEHEQEAAAVLLAVRRFRIPDRLIQIQFVNYDGTTDRPRAIRSYRVQTDSLRIVPDLVAAIVMAGADRVQEVRYGVSDPERHADAALAAAADRALSKARRLAEQMGVRLGPVRAILESGLTASDPQVPIRAGRTAETSYYVDGVRIEGGAYATGTQTVSARVVVEYDLIVPAVIDE